MGGKEGGHGGVNRRGRGNTRSNQATKASPSVRKNRCPTTGSRNTVSFSDRGHWARANDRRKAGPEPPCLWRRTDCRGRDTQICWAPLFQGTTATQVGADRIDLPSCDRLARHLPRRLGGITFSAPDQAAWSPSLWVESQPLVCEPCLRVFILCADAATPPAGLG